MVDPTPPWMIPFWWREHSGIFREQCFIFLGKKKNSLRNFFFFFGENYFYIPENNLILVEPANSTRVLFVCISQAMLHEVSRERERDPENLQLVAARKWALKEKWPFFLIKFSPAFRHWQLQWSPWGAAVSHLEKLSLGCFFRVDSKSLNLFKLDSCGQMAFWTNWLKLLV